jgi:hypothetical protein
MTALLIVETARGLPEHRDRLPVCRQHKEKRFLFLDTLKKHILSGRTVATDGTPF